MTDQESIQNQAVPALNFIRANDHFLLTAHVNCDGDAIASALATYRLLEKMGKSSRIIFHDQKIDSRYEFLPCFEKIESYSDEKWDKLFQDKRPAVIALDTPSYKRLGSVGDRLKDQEPRIKIDHHPCEDEFSPLDWVNIQVSSTTSMIYEIARMAGVEIDPDLAKLIYTGIAYDTGRFSFSNTGSRDMFIAGQMIEAGVKPEEILNRIFFENSLAGLQTIGKGLASMESHLDGAVQVIFLSAPDMKDVAAWEIEELATYSVCVRGTKIGLFIREIEADFFKISLRSHSEFDVNDLAKKFGGGGHSRAAGCRIRGSKDLVLKQLITAIEETNA